VTTNYEDHSKFGLEASYTTKGGICKLIIRFDTKARSNGCVKYNENDFLGSFILHNAKDSKADG
jgi:hypothetical protein